MSVATQGTLLLALGFVAARLVQTGGHLNYLKASMGKWLLAAALIVIVVGLISLLKAFLGRVRGSSHDHPMTRAAWLLLAPALALIVLPSDPLGAFAADRRDIRQPETANKMRFDELPAPTNGAVELGLREFADRAYLDEERSLEDTRVRLTGFVVPAQDDESFVLSRFVILCCAADAYPVEIAVYGADAPPVDSWVVVTGTWRTPKARVRPYVDLVDVEAETVERIERPENPYDPA